jgi:ElaB/YqjD/DUF883 family membrane-anchored ribosome-binding protein
VQLSLSGAGTKASGTGLKPEEEVMVMADDNSAALPDGTDKVIAGTSRTEDTADTAVAERPAPTGTDRGIAGKFRSGGEKLANQAGDRARGLVSQGLERSAEALANVSKLVGDTAEGLDDRLGEEYGDYARRAAGAIENAANTIASKDPDELIDDTRNFVRNSPGIALAGAAVVGFVVARLLKSGLGKDEDDDDED